MSSERDQLRSTKTASVDPTEAGNARAVNPIKSITAFACHDKPSYWPLIVPARDAMPVTSKCNEGRVAGRTAPAATRSAAPAPSPSFIAGDPGRGNRGPHEKGPVDGQELEVAGRSTNIR
jgi:hypothetical protein